MQLETSNPEYTHIWHKYRPVILRMMIDADAGVQHYSFSRHEFRRIIKKGKENLAFILYLRKSKALNNIKTSQLAHALLSTLQQSKTAIELTADATFELMLDNRFVLHVKKAGVDEGAVIVNDPNEKQGT
jgi:hypothetical protein